MAEGENSPPRFICDAMLGGLARWLRAMGYDAEFQYGIDDGVLVRRAEASSQILLSSDRHIFERNVIKNGQVRSLYVPQQMGKLEQLRFVSDALGLTLRPPRCMACGGELAEIPKHSVMDEAPPLAYRNCERFWRCRRCDKLLWHGTHWLRIQGYLAELGNPARQEDAPPQAD